MPDLVPVYGPAIASLIVLGLIVLAQAFLGAIFGLVVGGGTPGAAPPGDYGHFGSRALRTHANSVENLSAFALLVIMAMFVSAEPRLINLLAMAHVAARILYWIVYYAGLGAVGGGPRTLIYVIGWGINVAIGVIALMAVLSQLSV